VKNKWIVLKGVKPIRRMNRAEKYVIKSVTFSVLEANDIRNMSVREITVAKDSGESGVYDS
jgi:hypothetical protein